MKKFSEGKAVAEKLLLQKCGCLSILIRYRNGGVNLKDQDLFQCCIAHFHTTQKLHLHISLRQIFYPEHTHIM